MSVQPADPDPLVDAALEVLRAHGPLTSEDWAEMLADAGHGGVEDLIDVVEMLDEPVLGVLADGRNVALDTLLEGRVFTHRVSAPEIASGVLYADPDLTPVVLLAMVTDDGPARVRFPDVDGDEFAALGLADEDFPDGAGLVFGSEALRPYSDGDLVGVRVRDGAVALESVDDVLAGPDLTAALDRIVGADNADNSETVVWQLLADDPTFCAEPTAPLGDVIDAAGYVREGDYIAALGFDFAAHHLASHIAFVARQAELHPDEVDGVISFVDLVGAVQDGGLDLAGARERIGADSGSFAGLEDPAAAAAALDVVNGFDDDHVPALYTAAMALAEQGPRRVRASGHWLAGMAADTLGDVREAERRFEDAAALDEEWTPALFELAQIASDRGDAQRGLSLLSRIDGGESERLYEVLRRFAPAEHPELGRNDKCWCGSGRKYKVCHLGKSDSTLDERAYWLYDKASMYAQSTSLFDLVLALSDLWAGDEDAVAVEPRALDVALFEGGLFDLFVTRRGVLLPSDELDLAQRWLQVRRSVHEVVSTTDSAAVLRDLRTGEQAEVDAAELEVGQLICARVVPTGTRTQILGGVVPVEPGRRDELLALLSADEVEPEDLVELLLG